MIAEIYKVRLSKFFDEESEELEDSEELIETDEQYQAGEDEDGNPIYRNYMTDLHHLSVLDEAWTKNDENKRKKEREKTD